MEENKSDGACTPSFSSAELERTAFDEWYATQKHQLSNEQVCRVIWNAATKIEREACKTACRNIAARYPTDIWPEDGKSLDCKSARMARLTAANCEREIDMRSNA